MLQAITAEPIEKERISALRFSDPSTVHGDGKELRRKLELATRMGNIDHVKVRILFQDDDGPKFTETTIWATSEKHIVLKGGVTIPFRRVIDVRLI
jgi:hypothetical protein